MDICELMAKKADYEREVIFAKAKVSVIEDLIALEQSKVSAEIVEPEIDTETLTTSETY